MTTSRYTMITARVSPMVELARWLFERQGVTYVEQAHVPMLHALATLRVGGGVEVPAVVGPGSVWKGARDTLTGLDALAAPGMRIYGDDETERTANKAFIERLLGHLLQTVRRHVYHQLLPYKHVLYPVVTEGAPGWERAFVRHSYPAWRWLMGRGLNFTPELLAQAPIEIGKAMALVEEELARRHTPFIGGERPGPVDIIASALLAPVVLPPNYGSKLPSIDQLPPALRAFTDAARGRPVGDLVLRTYREARSAPYGLN